MCSRGGWKEVIKTHMQMLITPNFAESANLSSLTQQFYSHCVEMQHARGASLDLKDTEYSMSHWFELKIKLYHNWRCQNHWVSELVFTDSAKFGVISIRTWVLITSFQPPLHVLYRALIIDMNGKIYGALVQFGCYQHRYEWKGVCGALVQFGCYQHKQEYIIYSWHKHKWMSQAPSNIVY